MRYRKRSSRRKYGARKRSTSSRYRKTKLRYSRRRRVSKRRYNNKQMLHVKSRFLTAVTLDMNDINYLQFNILSLLPQAQVQYLNQFQYYRLNKAVVKLHSNATEQTPVPGYPNCQVWSCIDDDGFFTSNTGTVADYLQHKYFRSTKFPGTHTRVLHPKFSNEAAFANELVSKYIPDVKSCKTWVPSSESDLNYKGLVFGLHSWGNLAAFSAPAQYQVEILCYWSFKNIQCTGGYITVNPVSELRAVEVPVEDPSLAKILTRKRLEAPAGQPSEAKAEAKA